MVSLFALGIGGSYARCTPEQTDEEREFARARRAYLAIDENWEYGTQSQQRQRDSAHLALDAAIDAFVSTTECNSACRDELTKTTYNTANRTRVVLAYARVEPSSDRIEWLKAIFLGRGAQWLAGCFAALLLLKRSEASSVGLTALLLVAAVFGVLTNIGIAIWLAYHHLLFFAFVSGLSAAVYGAMLVAEVQDETRQLIRRVATLLAVAVGVGSVVYGKSALSCFVAILAVWNPMWSLAESFRSWMAVSVSLWTDSLWEFARSRFATWSTPPNDALGRAGSAVSFVAAVPLVCALVTKGVHIATSIPGDPMNIAPLAIVAGILVLAIRAMTGYLRCSDVHTSTTS